MVRGVLQVLGTVYSVQTNLTVVYCLTIIIIGLLSIYVTKAFTRIEKRTYLHIYNRTSRGKSVKITI